MGNFDFVEELNKYKGFTLTSSNGTLWLTKLRNKSMTLCYRRKGDSVFYPIGLIRDKEAFEEFFKGYKERRTNDSANKM